MTSAFAPLSASVALTVRMSSLESKVPSGRDTVYGAPKKTGALSLTSVTVMLTNVVVICWGEPENEEISMMHILTALIIINGLCYRHYRYSY